MGLADLATVAPEVQYTLKRLQNIVRERDEIMANPTLDQATKNSKVIQFNAHHSMRKRSFFLIRFEICPLQIDALNYDGCPIADLGFTFTLPGHPSIELRRGYRDTAVTIHNLHQYVALVTNWFLVEGVQGQFEALREGIHILHLSTLVFFLFLLPRPSFLTNIGFSPFHFS